MQKVEIEVKVVGGNKAKADIKSIETTIKDSSGGIAKGVFTGVAAFSALQAGIGAAISVAEQFATAAAQVAMKSITMAAELEESRVAFDTMIGSGEKAGEFLKDLEKFALRTPFNLGDLQEQSKRLLAYGFNVDEVIPIIEDLGNIAAGVGRDKLPQLTLAFGQVKAAGKLTGMELRQFTEAGVPLLEELAKVTKKSAAQVKSDMEKGIAPSFEQVRQALDNLSGPGGRFEDLMDKQSRTLPGIISNLQDYGDKMFRLIGGIDSAGTIIEGGFLDKVKGVVDFVGKFLDENAEKINKFVSGLSTGIGTIIDTISRIITAIVTDEGVVGAFNQMKTAITEAWAVLTGNEDIKTSLEDLKKNYIDFVVTALKDMFGIVKEIFTYIKEHPEEIQGFIDNLKETYTNAKNVWNALKDIYNTLKMVGNIAKTINPSAQIASLITRGKFITPDGGADGGVFQAYAGGGVIPGPSTSGDRMTARVNSGEMIINQGQQSALWRFIQNMSRPNVNFNGAVNFAGQRGERQQMDVFSKLLNMA